MESVTTIQNGNVIITQTIPVAEYAITVQNKITEIINEIANQQNVLLSLQNQATGITTHIASLQDELLDEQALLVQLDG